MERTALLERYLGREASTALVVVDMQDGYANPNSPLLQLVKNSTDQLQSIIKPLGRFINTARERNIPVIWTYMAEDPSLMAENMREKMEIEGTPVITTPGHPTYELYGLSRDPKDFVIEKRTYNAFTNTGLHELLQKLKKDTLILTGAYASRCVAATAFKASDELGYRLLVPEDLVAGDDSMAQETEAFLKTVRIILGETATSEQILEYWKPSSG